MGLSFQLSAQTFFNLSQTFPDHCHRSHRSLLLSCVNPIGADDCGGPINFRDTVNFFDAIKYLDVIEIGGERMKP